MRLRRVVISGFKTFARRSEVRLDPGITAIVGPNGSGKSNLVDAIRWALGETNARELRGARMDEVIYAGGAGRARMGYAEVELILDNEDGRLPVEDVEVSVSRRVVRHGDSDFRLNGDRVRLRDVERLLGTTGLTQTGYAVVAQDDIDAIIEATPSQRRALVEQAAGVRSLRAACEEALGRVVRAEVTLRRFEDLLAETEPRLAELAAQAELAREQAQLAERLAALRGSLAREAWRGARAQQRGAQRRRDAADRRLEAATVAQQAFTDRLAVHRARLDEQRAGRGAAARRLEEARVAAERATGDRRRAADRARSGVLARAVAAAEMRVAAAEATAREADRADLAAAHAPAAAAARALEARRAQAQQAFSTAGAEQHRLSSSLVAAEAALRGAEEERLEAGSALQRQATQVRLVADAADAVRRRVDSAIARVGELTGEAAAAADEVGRAAAACQAATAARVATAAALDEARRLAGVAQGSLDSARQQARAALGRAAALRGQVEGAIGGRGAIAEAVAAGELSARRLVDCFVVADAGDAPAVEAALEGHLGAWIVDSLDEAAALLDPGSAREELLLSGDEAGQAPPAPDGARAVAGAVVAAAGAAAALAHCLEGTWLVTDHAAGRRVVAATGGRAVLPDGTVLTSAGLRAGGRPGRTLELAALDRQAAAAAAHAVAAEHAAEGARASAAAAVATAEARDRDALEQFQRSRIDEVAATASAGAAGDALAAEQRRLDAGQAELTAREAEHADLAGAGAAATTRLAAAQDRLDGARASAEAARLELAAAAGAAATAADALRAVEVEAGRSAVAAAEHARRVDAAIAAAAQAALRRDAAASRVLAAELEVLGALAHGWTAGQAAAAATGAVAAALQALAATAPDLAESEGAVAALDAQRSEVAVAVARAQDECAAATRELVAAESRVRELADAVRDDDDDDGPEPEAGDGEKAEREILRLERRIAALGPVNALAPDQHDRLAARVAALRSGRDDLGGACADIRAIAARLTSAIDSRFDAVFGAVSVHFHDLFAELFPGGRATLRREEPAAGEVDEGAVDPVRRAGVEILAQPPGKRLQPLSLLSGGERALTALAVILALQQVNPSPFYVFDEVDAPLDDSNVLRFTRLLTRLSQAQQFIVVTHNHITMAAADALHGVTSDADGISSVISVRFDAESGGTVPEANVVGLRQSTLPAAV